MGSGGDVKWWEQLARCVRRMECGMGRNSKKEGCVKEGVEGEML